MKLKFLSTIALAAVTGLALTSCEDYLTKPTIDNYNADLYYETDQQCLAGTSYLYSSPWSDFARSFILVGEVLSGNYYQTATPYHDFTVNSSDSDLGALSASVWSAIAHCNTVYNYIKGASGPSQAAKDQTLGECLTWKAMGYFFLARTFGETPIIHDNSASLGAGDYNTVPKVKKADVYEYIIMTLEKAIEILPEVPLQAGRIDKAAAQGLLAKVYLAKAGLSGTINTADLDKAIKYAKDCIASPYHSLLPNYADNFRLKNNINPECLISWRWNAQNNQWTDQSFFQSDYATEGFSEFGDIWGGWKGMSIDLQEEFGIKLLEQTPQAWLLNRDTRLKATMMLPGFTYEYFWQDHGGFDWLRFIYDKDYNPSAYYNAAQARYGMETPTGAAPVKHLWGNANDHLVGAGHAADRMASSLATHLLRLSDVYLILAESIFLKENSANPQSGSSTNAEALAAINAVRERAGVNKYDAITFADIWKERRLELAFEGDRWYDYVRVSYYNPDFCIQNLKNQKRNTIWSLDNIYYNYYAGGQNESDWVVDPETDKYDDTTPPLGDANIKSLMKTDADSGKLYFALPFTTQDMGFNANLAPDVPAEHVDVREVYSY